MQPVDRILQSEFEALEAQDEGLESSGGSFTLPALPMLLRVAGSDWEPNKQLLPDYEERFRVGNIIGCSGTAQTLRGLALDPGILSIEASRSSDESALDCNVSVPTTRGDKVHVPPLSEEGDNALVAVIDLGIDVTHEAFLDAAGDTRIHYVWDQRDAKNAKTPVGYKTGTLYTRADISDFIHGVKPVPLALSRVTNASQHGTHVTSIAAGRRVSAPNKFAGGMAPSAGIIVVIPKMLVDPGDPQSLGYSQSHLLALKFIREKAEELKLPVVVNLSAGMNAGAHDGTSALEAGFDTICEGGRLPGYIIVKSAGNERDWNGHAKVSLGKNSTDEFRWTSSKQNRNADRLELWFKACDPFDFVLEDPAGEKSAVVNWANPDARGLFTSGNKYELDYERYHHDNGDSRLTVIVRDSSSNILPKTWKLMIKSGDLSSRGEIHAWIERDDRRAIAFANHLNEEVTLSIPGTAASVIAVASIGGGASGMVSSFSSYGLTRDGRLKPDVAAPGEDISAAAHGTSNDVLKLSGTSMATPHVSGAIALLLSRRQKKVAADRTGRTRQLNAAQVKAALDQCAQSYNGQHNLGRGFGVLDAQALVEAFG